MTGDVLPVSSLTARADSMLVPGDQLEHLCSSAQHDLILVSPFIKVNALERVLRAVPHHVSITCVTRWGLEEIAAGVSDIEVWLVLQQRPSTTLWLRADLHAKFYRADQTCLVGSANLTLTALGWTFSPNFEVLVTLPSDYDEIRDFETQLFTKCIPVDQQLFERFRASVDLMDTSRIYVWPDNIVSVPNSLSLRDTWLPSLRNPDMLYAGYVGDWDRLTIPSREASVTDLNALNIPAGLSRQAFEAYVGVTLLQMPLIQRLDQFVEIPQRFGAVSNLLSTLPCAEAMGFDSDRTWQTTIRWLLHFLGDRYRLKVPNHSEVFEKIRTQ